MSPEQRREQAIKDYETTQKMINEGKITFKGGNGSSEDNAIIIKSTSKSKYGINAEYIYIKMNHGERGNDWDLISQALGGNDRKKYDILTIKDLKTNEEKIYYFDITNFFGR